MQDSRNIPDVKVAPFCTLVIQVIPEKLREDGREAKPLQAAGVKRSKLQPLVGMQNQTLGNQNQK